MNALTSIIRKRPLATAIGLSAAVHLILFLPDQSPPATTERVLNAELTLSTLKARPLTAAPEQPASTAQPAAASTEPANAAEKKAPHKKPPALSSQQPAPEKTVREENEIDSPAAPQPAPMQNQAVQQQAMNLEKGLSDQVDELSSDPTERSYQQQILAHLRNHLAAPQEYSGSVRLSMTIRYGQIATDVQVLRSSGNPLVDDWAVKAAIGANPYPPVPTELSQPFTFRPTIAIGR
ncbi:TonB family protein [Thalassolituus marinus]|uniref:TonB family protein n=1 Tax=Thalassolituus marinus TaxID=671053 RepID=A0ABS7ZPM4_9GAMM|nr:TonB family protein [Thalassolituus marinus]MCA6063643.1 TonB family protein [Thalassolituus marinus]